MKIQDKCENPEYKTFIQSVKKYLLISDYVPGPV